MPKQFKIKAWLVSENGKIRHREVANYPNEPRREPLLYFFRTQAFEENANWNEARKKKNRRWVFERGVKLIPCEISYIVPNPKKK